jgi:hypothetical protein
MDNEEKNQCRDKDDASFLKKVKSLALLAYGSPLFVFITILVIGLAAISACRATRSDEFLQTILGCYLVGGLSLHGH